MNQENQLLATIEDDLRDLKQGLITQDQFEQSVFDTIAVWRETIKRNSDIAIKDITPETNAQPEAAAILDAEAIEHKPETPMPLLIPKERGS